MVGGGRRSACSVSPARRREPARWAPAAAPTRAMSHTTLQVQVKREPASGAELVAGLLPGAVVKLEAGAKHHHDASHAANINNGSIPVGIAVARQRMPHELGAPLLLPTHKDHHHRIADLGHTSPMCCHFISSDAASAAMTVGVSPAMGGALLHCEERATNQMAGWPVTSAHGVPPPPLAPPPTLWQYPAPMTMESMMVPPAPPAPPGGFQLVRDPASGALLLIPSADQFQQAVVWGGAPVLLPPPPLQLLGGGELLASATLHQHTQTTRLVALDKRAAGKLSVPAHALIKLEPDAALLDACQPPHCTKALQTVSSVASNGTVFGTEPSSLLATHLFYQPPANFMQIAQSPGETAPCRSTGTSPAARLSPLPEPQPADEPPGVVDASNQTDSHPYEDEDAADEPAPDDGKAYGPPHHRPAERDEAATPPPDAVALFAEPRCLSERSNSPDCAAAAPLDASSQSQGDDATCGDRQHQVPVAVEKLAAGACDTDIAVMAAACSVPRDVLTDNNSSSRSSNELIIDSASSDYARDDSECDKVKSKPMTKVDLSGLELLSNSIEQFETRNTALGTSQKTGAGGSPPFAEAGLPITQNLSIEIKSAQTLQLPPNVIIKTSPKSPPETKASVTAVGRFEFPVGAACAEGERCHDAPALGGLGLLCALAEQRFMEEVEDESRPAAPLAIKTEPGLARCGASVVKPDGDVGPRLKLKDIWKTKCKNMEYGSDFAYRYAQNFDGANSSKDPEDADGSASKSIENIKIRTEKGEAARAERSRESDGDGARSYKICAEKRRSSEKARGVPLPAFDSEELMESLDDTYQRIAHSACKDSRSERAGLPTTVELVNAMELDMRIRLADLQRQCKEKQRELSKMTPRAAEETPRRGPGRPRKKSVAGEVASAVAGERALADFSAAFGVPCKEDETSLTGDAMLTLSALCKDTAKRHFSPVADSNSSQSSVERTSSSKKRKVGRPKKLPSTPGSPAATETIVAKKPKSKSSLVGYLLAAKSRLNMNAAKGGIIYSKTNPPRPFEDEATPRKHGERKAVKVKTNKRAHSSNCYSSPASSLSEYRYPADEGERRYASFLTSKVRPKLKAEAKVKEYSEEDDASGDWGGAQATLADGRSTSSSMESLREVRLKNKEKTDQIALKHNKLKASKEASAPTSEAYAAASDSDKEAVSVKKRRKSAKWKECMTQEAEPTGDKGAARCTLMEADLARDKVRVLTAMGGLFYAGTLSAVQAPDVYAVTLDGERGNRPHILSREETLRDTILEVCPTSAQQLPAGTRLCAYWSQQYRCLYPGTVAEPAEPNPPPDDRFVSVEFDDGDSGRIALEDIRWLQPDYPVVEYDPNPLLTLGKRRRQTSVNSNEEKKPQIPPLNNLNSDRATPNTIKLIRETTGVHSSTDKQNSDSEDRHRERKKLKKHRKEKLKRLISKSGDENGDVGEYIKKKKKKHKCCGEHCKHRKHKKHHRKHRKRHHSSCKEHSSSSSDDHNRNKSSTDYEIRSSRDDSNDEENNTLVTVSGNNDMKKVIKKKNLVKNAVLDIDKLSKAGESGCSIEVGSSSDVPIVMSSLKLKKVKKDNLKDSGIGLEDEQDGKSAELSSNKSSKILKSKKRTVSTTSSSDGAAASKMAAFLPGTALWGWRGVGHRRPAVKGRARKLFYKAIQRGQEVINVGDAAVFLSTGRPDRPYIGQVVALWEGRGASMAVRVRWYYHPDETVGAPGTLQYLGGLFESPHTDENDVQTISHKCEVLPLADYKTRLGDEPQRYAAVYDNNDLYYLAGRYDPTHQLIKMQPDIPLAAEQ